MRVLRGAWSRRGTLSTLLLMTAVVAGGAVVVMQHAIDHGLSLALTSPLLLLGAVAVPSIGAELAVARREEVGLARLRGIRGLRLWRFVLLEPALAIALGTAVGVGVGAATGTLSRTPLLAALAIALGAVVIVATSAGATLREPLAAQVATRSRPRRATTVAIFLTLLVLVSAGVAAYRSRIIDPDVAAPDLVVLLGPALVGLALAQAAIWLVRVAARVGTGLTAERGTSAFLTARRLARADDLVTPIRLVVAAAVVGSLALTGSAAVASWTDAQARADTAGPRVVDVPSGAIGAWQVTHDLDPEGDHLMATTLVPSELRPAERRAFVDAPRWKAVVGDFYDGTPLEPAADAVPRLVGDQATLPLVRADRLTVSATAVVKERRAPETIDPTSRMVGSRGVDVSLTYVRRDDSAGSVTVPIELLAQGDHGEASVKVPECRNGCLVTGLSVRRQSVFSAWTSYDPSRFVVLLDRVTLGDQELTDRTWSPDPAAIEADRANRWGPGTEREHRVLVNRPDGVEVSLLKDRDLPLREAVTFGPLPVLVAGDPPAEVRDVASDERRPAVLGSGDVLPLVGSTGVVADLVTGVTGAGPTVPGSATRIVASADAPDSLLDQVATRTDGTWRTLDDVRRSLADEHGGAQAQAYALTALACALVALLALTAGAARHLRDYRRDVAALRSLGIDLATARRAGRLELLWLAALVGLAVGAGGWVAVALLLGGLPLTTPPVAALALDTSPALWPLLVPAVVAVVAVLVVGGRAREVRAGATRPGLLREEEGR